MNIFGMLFSVIASWGAVTETPRYDSLGDFAPEVADLGKVRFEVRSYDASVAAETCNQDKPSDFMLLAEYIGVMTAPANSRGEKIAMTAPVVEYEKENGEECMQFILPESVYGSKVSSAPEPTDDNVKLLGRPQMIMAAVTFNGWASSKVFQAKLTELKLAIKALENDDSFLWIMKDPAHTENYQYNDPMTPAVFRTNEAIIELVPKN